MLTNLQLTFIKKCNLLNIRYNFKKSSQQVDIV